MMPTYNGWADEPEEEREAIDQFEMTLANAALKRSHPLKLRGLVSPAAAREIPPGSAA